MKKYLWAAAAVFAVAVDLITKRLAVLYLLPVKTVPLIEDALHLTYVENTGASFGMLKDHRWLFMSVSSVAIIAMIIYMLTRKQVDVLFGISAGMVIGGGVGNMIDRVALGYVVDFIDFRLINFAVFNGADSFICVGAVLLCIYVLRSEAKTAKVQKAAKKAQLDGSGIDENNKSADMVVKTDDTKVE